MAGQEREIFLKVSTDLTPESTPDTTPEPMTPVLTPELTPKPTTPFPRPLFLVVWELTTRHDTLLTDMRMVGQREEMRRNFESVCQTNSQINA
jgi:hypothetical protein